MAYKIIYLPAAEQDIDDIAAYLSQFYKSTFAKFMTMFNESILYLQDSPYIGTAYKNYRKLVVLNYLVFYKVDEKQKVIKIHRILHGKRDLEVSKFVTK